MDLGGRIDSQYPLRWFYLKFIQDVTLDCCRFGVLQNTSVFGK